MFSSFQKPKMNQGLWLVPKKNKKTHWKSIDLRVEYKKPYPKNEDI